MPFRRYDAHYAPNAAVLVIAGDATPEQVRELAETHYGPVEPKADAPPQSAPARADQRRRRIERVDARVAQPVMIRTVIAPERNSGDQQTAAALTVLADLLAGSSQTSMLARELMLTGKALYVNAFYDGFSVDPTTFGISMVPAPGVENAEAEAALDAALAKFLDEGPDPAQLERVKTRIRAARIYSQDSAHGRAYDYGQGLATGLTVEDVNDWPEILAAVTPEDVRAAAKLVLDNRAPVTGWLLPAPDASADALQPVSAEAANPGEVE
nr:insulinase family protein [Paracoccus sp. (in: a-proteobacteria)]